MNLKEIKKELNNYKLATDIQFHFNQYFISNEETLKNLNQFKSNEQILLNKLKEYLFEPTLITDFLYYQYCSKFMQKIIPFIYENHKGNIIDISFDINEYDFHKYIQIMIYINHDFLLNIELKDVFYNMEKQYQICKPNYYHITVFKNSSNSHINIWQNPIYHSILTLNNHYIENKSILNLNQFEDIDKYINNHVNIVFNNTKRIYKHTIENTKISYFDKLLNKYVFVRKMLIFMVNFKSIVKKS